MLKGDNRWEGPIDAVVDRVVSEPPELGLLLPLSSRAVVFLSGKLSGILPISVATILVTVTPSFYAGLQ